MISMPDLMRASGLWESPLDPTRFEVVRAFYQRPWKNHCTMDDACVLAAHYRVDPVPLMKMLIAVGELEDLDI